MPTVLHLVGSPTSTFFADLSRLYAADCLQAIDDPARYRPVVAYVSPDSTWRFPIALDDDSLAAAPALTQDEALAHLAVQSIDVALPQMFCLPGMTAYRSLLDSVDIPFIGNTAEAMALGADKMATKRAAAAAGIDVPHATVVDGDDDLAPLAVEFPVVVKPVDADNSDGVSLVRERSGLTDAVTLALEHSTRAMIEDFVPLGREVRCGVLEREGELTVLPLEEYAVDARTKPVRDRGDKLAVRDGGLTLTAKTGSSAWIVPADDPVNGPVAEAARRAHRAVGARHYSLFDFRIDPVGRPWLLEAGLYCSFARTSVVVMMAGAAGITVRDLFADAVQQVVTRA